MLKASCSKVCIRLVFCSLYGIIMTYVKRVSPLWRTRYNHLFSAMKRQTGTRKNKRKCRTEQWEVHEGWKTTTVETTPKQSLCGATVERWWAPSKSVLLSEPSPCAHSPATTNAPPPRCYLLSYSSFKYRVAQKLAPLVSGVAGLSASSSSKKVKR